MGYIDKSKNSSTVALIAAATVVIALLITTPVMVGMYLDIHKAKHVIEKRVTEIDDRMEKLKKDLERNERITEQMAR